MSEINCQNLIELYNSLKKEESIFNIEFRKTIETKNFLDIKNNANRSKFIRKNILDIIGEYEKISNLEEYFLSMCFDDITTPDEKNIYKNRLIKCKDGLIVSVKIWENPMNTGTELLDINGNISELEVLPRYPRKTFNKENVESDGFNFYSDSEYSTIDCEIFEIKKIEKLINKHGGAKKINKLKFRKFTEEESRIIGLINNPEDNILFVNDEINIICSLLIMPIHEELYMNLIENNIIKKPAKDLILYLLKKSTVIK